MKTIREGVFETNSSSTHSLTIIEPKSDNYLSPSRTLMVDFMNTDDECVLVTLREKVSYLVSQIINNYKWDVYDYEDLKEQIENNRDFIRIQEYVAKKFKRNVVLPKTYKGNLEDIVNINHQLHCKSLDECLEDICTNRPDLLEIVLSEDTAIEFGRD